MAGLVPRGRRYAWVERELWITTKANRTGTVGRSHLEDTMRAPSLEGALDLHLSAIPSGELNALEVGFGKSFFFFGEKTRA